METRHQKHSLGEHARARVLRKPATGRSVWPGQRCPAFTARTVALCHGSGCWFCRYANFHLTQQTALEVGICCWPECQTD